MNTRDTTLVRGFSLSETMVVIAMTGVLATALSMAIVSVYRNNAFIFEATASVESARGGLGKALQDIREATYGDNGNYPLGEVATSSVTFYSDVDQDGGIERVRIYLLNGTLYKVVTNAGGTPPSYIGQTPATSTIATYVTNGTSTPLFTYYDTSGMQLSTTSTDVAQVRSVAMTIMVDLNPNRAPNVLTLSGTAMIRNLRD